MSKNIIAKLAALEAAQDGTCGQICVEVLPSGTFRVFSNGGTLPDGEEHRDFVRRSVAISFATEIVQTLLDEAGY